MMKIQINIPEKKFRKIAIQEVLNVEERIDNKIIKIQQKLIDLERINFGRRLK